MLSQRLKELDPLPDEQEADVLKAITVCAAVEAFQAAEQVMDAKIDAGTDDEYRAAYEAVEKAWKQLREVHVG